MHVCLVVQPSTLPQAARLLERIADLGGVSQYPCLIVSSGDLDLAPLHKLAASAFQSVSVFPVEIPPDYPKPDNILFQRTAQQMGMHVGDSYLYLEPDSWPTSSHWLKDLVSAYREHNLKFMGKLQVMPDGSGEHYMMTAGIYPKDFYFKSDLIRQIPASKNAEEFLQGEIVYRGKAHDSGLFSLDGEDGRNAALILGVKTGQYTLASSDSAEKTVDVEYKRGESLDAAGVYAGPSTQVNDVVGAFQQEMAKTFPDGQPQDAKYFPDAPLPATVDLPTGTVAHKLSSEAVKLDESWVNDPRALDPNVEVPTPVVATVASDDLPDSGHLPAFPQPAEPALTFATEEERNAAIKKSQADGMGWKALLATYKLSPVAMKKVLNGAG